MAKRAASPNGIVLMPVLPSTTTVLASQSGNPIDTSSPTLTPVSNNTVTNALSLEPIEVDEGQASRSSDTSIGVWSVGGQPDTAQVGFWGTDQI